MMAVDRQSVLVCRCRKKWLELCDFFVKQKKYNFQNKEKVISDFYKHFYCHYTSLCKSRKLVNKTEPIKKT